LAPKSDRRHTLELDDQQKKTVERSLVERQGRLIEAIGDTTLSSAAKWIGMRELRLIMLILRRLRAVDGGQGALDPVDPADDE
jgi:hypothetical protein